MNIKTNSKLDQATPYFKALSTLWGLGEVKVVSAYNLDYLDENSINKKINSAIKKGLKICEDF